MLLGCFATVNAALIVLKRRPGEPRGAFEVPTVVPALGVVVCVVLIAARVATPNAEGELEWRAPLIALALLAGIVLLYAFLRPKNVTEQVLAEVGE